MNHHSDKNEVDIAGRLIEDGYVIVPRLLTDEKVRELRRELSEMLSGISTGHNLFLGYRTRRLHGLLGRTRALDNLVTDPIVLEVIEKVLGHSILSASVAIEIEPGEKAQSPHYDDGIYPLPVDHPEVWLSAHWTLDDYTDDNGGTILYPGTRGDRLAGERLPRGFAPDIPAGSLLLYTGTFWHGGGENATERSRLGVVFSYVASWLRPQETQLLVVPPDVARTLSPCLRELLGYGIRPPFLGYVFGEDPRKILDEGRQL